MSEIRVRVPNTECADKLVRRLGGTAAVSLDPDRGVVHVEEGASRSGVLTAVEEWLEETGRDSATLWLDERSYTLDRRRPGPTGAGHDPDPRSTAFTVAARRLGEASVLVALTGEIDLYAAPAIERTLHAAVDDGARDLVVDLSGATFFDSTLLGVLLGAHKRLARPGGRLAIVCGDRNLAKIFEITGLARVFEIHPTLDAALPQVGVSEEGRP